MKTLEEKINIKVEIQSPLEYEVITITGLMIEDSEGSIGKILEKAVKKIYKRFYENPR